jgi:hypothetical protein
VPVGKRELVLAAWATPNGVGAPLVRSGVHPASLKSLTILRVGCSLAVRIV